MSAAEFTEWFAFYKLRAELQQADSKPTESTESMEDRLKAALQRFPQKRA